MHYGCGGHRHGGDPCGAQPLKGTQRCRRHLGRRVIDVRAEQEATVRARAIFAEHGLGEQDDPLRELQKLSRELIAWKNVCRVMVGSLQEVRYKSTGAGEQLRAEIGMYERSMAETAKVLRDLVKLGIEERLAKVDRRTELSIQRALEAALTELAPVLGFDPARPEITATVGRHLRLIRQDDAS